MNTEQILLSCGAIGGPLFIVLFLIDAALRPEFDALRQPVSALSIGGRGWIQQTNFVVTGALMLACGFGFCLALRPYAASFWESLLVALFAVGLIGAGVFVTDTTGLANDAPSSERRTTSGMVHDLFSLIVFVSLFADCFVFAHFFASVASPAWAVYSGATGLLFGAGFVLFARGFGGDSALAPIAGLLQRITIAIGWFWISLVALHFLL